MAPVRRPSHSFLKRQLSLRITAPSSRGRMTPYLHSIDQTVLFFPDRMPITTSNNQIVISGHCSENDETKYLAELDNLLSSRHHEHVAITSIGKTKTEDKVLPMLDVLIKNTVNFHVLRLSFLADPILAKILQHLMGKLSCHTLILSCCHGNEWMSVAAKFIVLSNHLHTVCIQGSSPNLSPELIKGFSERSNNVKKLQINQVDRYSPRGFYHHLAKLITESQIEVLVTCGRNFSPWGARALQHAFQTNVSLRKISCSPTKFSYIGNEWIPILEEFKNIVCADFTVDTVASSNNTLSEIDFSPHHVKLHEALLINRESITTKSKIKHKIFMCSDLLQKWMNELARDDRRVAIQEKRNLYRVHLIHWLANNNNGVEILAQQTLFDFLLALVGWGALFTTKCKSEALW